MIRECGSELSFYHLLVVVSWTVSLRKMGLSPIFPYLYLYLWMWPYLEIGPGWCNQLKLRSYWMRVGPSPMTGVLTGEGYLDTERTPRDKGKRLCNDVSISQGMLRVSGNNQKLGKGQGVSSPSDFRERIPLLTPGFWTSGFQNQDNTFLLYKATKFVVICMAALGKEYISYVTLAMWH